MNNCDLTLLSHGHLKIMTMILVFCNPSLALGSLTYKIKVKFIKPKVIILKLSDHKSYEQNLPIFDRTILASSNLCLNVYSHTVTFTVVQLSIIVGFINKIVS